MPRTIAEWCGKSDDSMPPPNVTLRIWTRAKGKCQVCERKLLSGDKWDRDHIVALADGGKNVESNFQVICSWCHGRKTSGEATERASVRAKAKKAAGIKRASRPFPGGKDDKWRRRMDGTVEMRGQLWPAARNRDELD